MSCRSEKPLFVSEYGSPALVAKGWSCPDCMDYPTKLLQYQASGYQTLLLL
jgi:hypothetical protein